MSLILCTAFVRNLFGDFKDLLVTLHCAFAYLCLINGFVAEVLR